MSLAYLLADIICQTFTEQCGKFQCKKPEAEQKAMVVGFSIPIDYDKEQGYRHLDVAIYGPMNYVGVWTRERWTVIPLEDLEDDGEGDTCVKKGKDYNKGQSEWKQVCYHDSGWRSVVQDIIFQNRDKLGTFDGTCKFYTLIDPKTLPEAK
jgi:hypothetical protein